MANRTLIPADAELWRRTGHAIPSCVDPELCIAPLCACQTHERCPCPTACEVPDDEWRPLSWDEALQYWAGTAVFTLIGLAILGAIFWPY